MAGSTSNRTLAPGSLLWGRSFFPESYVAGEGAAPLEHFVRNVDVPDLSSGLPKNIPLKGGGAAGDSAGDNAYLSCPSSLFFKVTDTNLATLALTFVITGRNQFGDDVTETFSTLSDATVYTDHCYSFVESIVVTASTAWEEAADLLTVGANGNKTIDWPIALPFRIISADHIRAMSVEGTQFPASDITISKVFNTATILNSATNVEADAIGPVGISLVPGAREVY